jgi:DNA invertase Pin-like site-specific DNA recombinase
MSVCFAYGRHSTEKQGLTEEVQREKCFAYYERELKPSGVQWGGFFYDKAVSAFKVPFEERPKGREVFAVAQPGDHVLVAKLNRCFRSLINGKSVIEQFNNRGVFFHSLDYKIDTRSANGRFILSIYLAGAELEVELARERAVEIINYRIENELPYTPHAPMGWKIKMVSGAKVYRVDENEREFIERLTRANAAGKSFNDLAIWCWINQKTIGQKRPFNTPDSVKWAIKARALGYPKVVGGKRIAKLFREWVKSGKV